jgi:hypothetical protein
MKKNSNMLDNLSSWDLHLTPGQSLGIFEYRSIRIRNRIPFLKIIFYVRIPITPCKIVFDYRLQYFFLHVRIK